MKDNESIIYKLLLDVFANKAYSGIKLNEALSETDNAVSKAYITKVFYGVIEKSIQFDYIINLLSDKKPKNNIIVLIKIGLYLLRYTDTPQYAAINKTVDLCKSAGKSGVSGFVNAILRKSAQIKLETLEYSSAEEKLSVLYSYPLWAVKLLIREYGESETQSFLSYKKRESTHIRCNEIKINKTEFESKLDAAAKKTNSKTEKSKLGYYVNHAIMKNLEPYLFTAQSYASMLAVNSYLNKDEARIYDIKNALDLCGAPGGKSIYLKQQIPELNIICCDVYPHKIKLINEYAARMGALISAELNDATKFRAEWEEKFDLVICDVPCSGLGLVNSKPDIILNRSGEDIEPLAKLQYEIIANAAKYLRKGGVLCYSTCTVIKEENKDIIDKFLKSTPEFEPMAINNGIAASERCLQLLPQKHDSDGFFIARMRRIK